MPAGLAGLIRGPRLNITDSHAHYNLSSVGLRMMQAAAFWKVLSNSNLVCVISVISMIICFICRRGRLLHTRPTGSVIRRPSRGTPAPAGPGETPLDGLKMTGSWSGGGGSPPAPVSVTSTVNGADSREATH